MRCSLILRVRVLRPHPSRRAASWRRPPAVPQGGRRSGSCSKRGTASSRIAPSPPAASRRSAQRAGSVLPVGEPRARLAGTGRSRAAPEAESSRWISLPEAITVSQRHSCSRAGARCPASPASARYCSTSGRSVFDLCTQLLGRPAARKWREQALDVLPALAQRRRVHADDVQPVEAGPRGTALAHPRLQVLVSRRDDAHVDPDRQCDRRPGRTRRRRAPAADGSAARPACRRSRRGTACRRRACSKRPMRWAWAPVKAPALVAEQLALQQLAREWRRC